MFKQKNEVSYHPKAMTTREAAAYLVSCGHPTSKQTLEVWRHYNRGPKYKKVGSFRVFYEKDWLDEHIAGIAIKVFCPSNCKEVER